MKVKTEQVPVINSYPVISVAKNGTVLYSNEAGDSLLHNWNMEIGGKLPSDIGDLVHEVITLNNPQKREVNVGKRIYLVIFHPLPEQECVNISGFDISDQKEFNEEFKVIERRLSEAQRMAHIGSWDWDIIRNKMYRSDELYHIFRLDPQEHDTTYGILLNYVHPDDRNHIEIAVREAFKGKPIDSNYRIILADGEERIVHMNGEVTFDERCTPVHMRGTVQDITKLKKAEERIRESEEKYRNIIETSNEGIATFDSEGVVTYINKKLGDMLGYTTEEIIGRSMWDFISDESKAIMETILKNGWQSVNESYELNLIRRDSSPLWSHVNSKSLFDKDGKSIGAMSMFTDITERKIIEKKLQESEEKYRNIVETANEGISMINDEGILTYVNEKMADMMGYSIEEIVGKTIWDFIDEDVKPIVASHFEKRHHNANDSFELRLKRKSGSPLWLILNSKSLFDGKGNFIGIFNMHTDITERKIAEDKLIKSEAKYRNIVETANEGIALFSSEGVLTYVNKKMADMIGYAAEEIAGKTIWDFVEEVDKSAVTESFEKRRRGINEIFDRKLIRKDGSPLWVLISSKSFFDDNGKYIGSLNMHTDITERKIAENKLRESERRLSEAQRMAHIGYWEWDIKNDKMCWSDEIEWIFGRSPQKFSVSFKTFLNCLPPDDQESVSNAIIEALNGKPYGIDYRVVLDNGEERIVHAQGEVIFDEKGNAVRMRGTVQDITERKKAEENIQKTEERYRIVTEKTGLLVYDKNFENNIIFWAGAVEEVFGYNQKEIEKFNFEDWIEHIHPEDRKFVFEKVMEARKLGGRDPVEYRLRKKDGTYIYVSDTGAYLKEENGKPYRILGVVQDITQRKQTEEALAKIEITRKKEIHHRIKNNLQVISSLLDLQAEQFRGKDCVKDSEIMEAFRESRSRVISMALIHEELYKGKGFETLNFSQYVKELAENLFQTYSIGDSDIYLKLDLEEDSFFDIDVAVPLGMIVNELVTNSFKHAFHGLDKGKIQIKLSREENEGCITHDEDCTTFVLSVLDNGIGIPEKVDIEDLDTLGMQLIITLVDQLDGELEIKRDNGTEFIIRFTVIEKVIRNQL